MTWLLEMKNITKTFGAVKAVDNVSLRLNAGEVVSLCGENGSGKSTLMKVLCGIYPHGSYEGEIIFAGETLQANHIRDTERKGIAISPCWRIFSSAPRYPAMVCWIMKP